MSLGTSTAAAALAAIALAAGAPAADAAFPGENGRIAFTSDRDGDFDLYTVDASGGGLSRLTDSSADDYEVTWSPDGTRIAFTSERDGNREVYVARADGSGVVNLSASAAEDYRPAWSPDSTMIAFTSTRQGSHAIHVSNADGSGPRPLTSGGEDFQPVWSPDGSRIAFVSGRDGNYEIYVMNADGSLPTRLTTDPAEDLQPEWSPDGSRIAFASRRTGDYDVFTMRADGSGQVNLTSSAGYDADPAWSPDGTRIAFASIRSGDVDVYTMRTDGTGAASLSAHTAFDAEPDWQPLVPPEPALPAPPGGGGDATPAPAQVARVSRGTLAYRGLLELSGTIGGDAGQPVTVEVAPLGRSREPRAGYRVFRRLVTGAEGSFSTSFRVRSSYRFRVNGPGGEVDSFNVLVRPRVASLVRGARRVGSTYRAARGRRLAFALRSTPMKRRAVFRIERRVGGRWRTAERRVVRTRRGRAKLGFRLTRPGTYRVRALTFSDGRHVAGRSHVRTLRVR